MPNHQSEAGSSASLHTSGDKQQVKAPPASCIGLIVQKMLAGVQLHGEDSISRILHLCLLGCGEGDGGGSPSCWCKSSRDIEGRRLLRPLCCRGGGSLRQCAAHIVSLHVLQLYGQGQSDQDVVGSSYNSTHCLFLFTVSR